MNISRVIRKKLSFLGPVPKTCEKWKFFANNSWITQNKYIKLYIFEIRIKFRVDWYIIWHILKNFKIFHFSRWSISWSRVWEPKNTQEIRNIVIIWSSMTHYNFLNPLSRNFGICRALIVSLGPCLMQIHEWQFASSHNKSWWYEQKVLRVTGVSSYTIRYTKYYTVGQTAYPKDKVAWSWFTTESRRH